MSSITVEEAMTVGALTRAQIIAGHTGLRNSIEHVTVLEIPDSEEWFKGHELIITAFYNIGDDVQRQLALLNKMKKMRAAALALCYPGLHYHSLSPLVLQRADELHLPIIEIPRDVPYIDIISPVVQEIQKNHSLEIRQMLQIQNYVTEWLADKLDHTVIIPKIGEILGDPLLLVDERYRELASYKVELVYTDPAESIAAYSPDEAEDSPFDIVEVIQSAERVYGYLCIRSDEKMPPFKEMLYHSVAVSLALYFAQEDAIQSAARDYQQTVLIHWLNGQEIGQEQLERSLHEAGHDLHSFGGMVILIAQDAAQQHQLHMSIQAAYEKVWHRKGMIITHGQQLVLLLPQVSNHSEQSDEYGHQLDALKTALPVPVIMVYQRIQRDLINEGAVLYRSLLDILHFRRRMPALSDLLCGDRLPLFQMLRHMEDDTLQRVLQPLLEPLLQYDRKMNADFLDTLEYFLFYPEQQELPDVLHIHRNTLNYRKQRIIDILKVNPFENPHRIHFEMAVLLNKL